MCDKVCKLLVPCGHGPYARHAVKKAHTGKSAAGRATAREEDAVDVVHAIASDEEEVPKISMHLKSPVLS